jgi:Transposase DDE domain group 1
MQTKCTPKLFEFEAVERRSVVAGFDGGNITSNAGALLLGQVDQGVGLVRRFAACFSLDFSCVRSECTPKSRI